MLADIDNAPAVEYTFEEAFQKTVCEQRLYCPQRPQGEISPMEIVAGKCPIDANGDCPLKPKGGAE